MLLLVVKFRPDAQEKIVSAVELLSFSRGNQLRLDEFLGRGQSAFDPANPEQILVIAQAAAAIFDIGLLEKNRITGLGVALLLIGDAPVEEFLFMSFDATALEGFFKLG